MSNILCQMEKWGRSYFFRVFVSKYGKDDSIDAGVIRECSHGSSPPSYFSESSFDGVGSAQGRRRQREGRLQEGQ